MKKNTLFTVLTAVIVVTGFYAMDIAKFFGIGSDYDGLVRKARVDTHRVLLSDRGISFDPMTLVNKYTAEAYAADDEKERTVATAIVKTLARGSDTTSIAWGIHTELIESWKTTGNGYIFVDGWEYVGGSKTERLLDCIVDTSDYSVAYIRFYDKNTSQPSANDMNRGLEHFDAISEEFYPNIAEITAAADKKYAEAKKGKLPPNDSRSEYYPELFSDKRIYTREPHALLLAYIHRYDAARSILEWAGVPETGLFWLTGLSMSTVDILDDHQVRTDNFRVNAKGISEIVEQLGDMTYNPTYSAFGGRIYQSLALGENKLTVIYSVRDEIIEGFYYHYPQLKDIIN